MGAFLSGLAFCQDSTSLDTLFRRQFKQVMIWLMKIFFAATIGFQVPIRSFANRKVVQTGFFFTLALLGKFAVGLLTPNFDQTAVKYFRGTHLRDCVLVGLSMMGEAEFAFVVALFGFTEGLVPPDMYASIVLAILMSTIISPFLLRTVLALWKNNPEDLEDDLKLDQHVDLSMKPSVIVSECE